MTLEVNRGSAPTITVFNMDYVQPPSNPNEWTDEEWLEWLKATDRVPFDDLEESISEVVTRIVQSTPGVVIGQAMLGMAQAIYGRQQKSPFGFVQKTMCFLGARIPEQRGSFSCERRS